MKILLIKPYFEYPAGKFPDIEFYMNEKECLDAEAVIGFSSNIREETLEKMVKVKWIQLLSAGYDDVDLEYVKKRGITLTNARGIYSIPIAEDIVCKILMSNCNALEYIENGKNHIWKKSKGRTELCGQTIGIIGTGSIASETASRLKPFGVKVIGCRRKEAPLPPNFDEVHTGTDGLNKLLSESDYVVVTVDLNSSTKHMLNADNLQYMKEGSSIVNVARGSIINQKDLTDILKKGKIKYAGLDVFETEPLPDEDELWKLDNVYITPHNSGTVYGNKKRIEELIVENIQRYRNNRDLINVVQI